MNDWGEKDDMVKITAKSITFDEICKVNNITNIEYLQIDTEGFDCEIIKMIDLKNTKLNKLDLKNGVLIQLALQNIIKNYLKIWETQV